MTAQVAADLRAAAELLKARGWTRGDWIDETSGCLCAGGALRVATGAMEIVGKDIHFLGVRDAEAKWRRMYQAEAALVEFLALPDVGDTVPDWNDDCETADEVIAALEAAADAAEAQQ